MRSLSLVTLALLPLAAGCGISPGDYVVYRVATSVATAGEDCFPDGQDPDDADDSTSFRTGETFALFTAGGGAYFLDMRSDVLEGAGSGGSYVFEAEEIDVDYFGNNDASSQTTTQTLTVTLDTSGASVSGRVEATVAATCDGSDCGGFEDVSCTNTTEFVGTRVDGVELTHPI